jgi:aryl-alcohol dehydrogenase
MKVRAAVVERERAPFRIEELELDDPRAREVVVRVVAAGICHSDLVARDGLWSVPFPLVCGHEGAGIVEAVGSDVSTVRPGDHVLCGFAFCGSCRNCLRGLPSYCDLNLRLNFAGTRLDGSTTLRRGGEPVHGCFIGQSSFATHALADERAVVPVGPELPLELLAPLACGVQTGAGSVLNALRPEAGSSIVIFGVGPVGLSAVLAARVAGCSPIVAVDLKPNRVGLAHRFGANVGIDASAEDPVAAIRELTDGGAAYSLETTGSPHALRQAVDCLRDTGVCGLVGLAPQGVEAKLEMTRLLRGIVVRGIIEGDAVPRLFIPVLIDLYRQGQFAYESMIDYFRFEEINDAVDASERGEVLKPVLTF